MLTLRDIRQLLTPTPVALRRRMGPDWDRVRDPGRGNVTPAAKTAAGHRHTGLRERVQRLFRMPLALPRLGFVFKDTVHRECPQGYGESTMEPRQLLMALCLCWPIAGVAEECTLPPMAPITAKTGTVLIEPRFDYARPFSGGYALVELHGKVGWILAADKFVVEPQFDNVFPESEGLFPVQVGGKNGPWGFADMHGRIKINPVYSHVLAFRHGAAGVEKDDEHFVIDISGNRLSPEAKERWSSSIPNYERGQEESRSGKLHFALDPKSGKYGIQLGGQWTVPPQFDQVGAQIDDTFDPCEGLASVRVGKSWGFIDQTGRYVVNPIYADAVSFHHGLAVVQVDNPETGKWGLIDPAGRFVVKPIYDAIGSFFDDGLAPVAIAGKVGFIDRTGGLVIAPRYERGTDLHTGKPANLWFFHDGAIPFYSNGNWGYLSR